MKKYFALCIAFIATSFCFTSCEDDEKDEKDEITYNSADLVGYWVSGTEYYRFDSNGQGALWDSEEYVLESDIAYGEDGSLDWTLEGDKLTIIHLQTMDNPSPTSFTTRVIPKSYTIVKLTATTLSFKDTFDKTYTYTKTTQPSVQ